MAGSFQAATWSRADLSAVESACGACSHSARYRERPFAARASFVGCLLRSHLQNGRCRFSPHSRLPGNPKPSWPLTPGRAQSGKPHGPMRAATDAGGRRRLPSRNLRAGLRCRREVGSQLTCLGAERRRCADQRPTHPDEARTPEHDLDQDRVGADPHRLPRRERGRSLATVSVRHSALTSSTRTQSSLLHPRSTHPDAGRAHRCEPGASTSVETESTSS